MRWLLVCLAACGYSPDRVGTDAPGADDSPTSSFCFGQFARVCLAKLPVVPFDVTGGANTVFTDMPDMCEVTTSESTVTACVIAGTTITIDGTLTGVGSRPLVLLATEGAIIVPDAGLVDVASHRASAARGAGANPIGSCLGGTAATGAGGGAGGSFGGAGGVGGTGNGSGAGAPNPVDTPTALRGGCAGGAGGTQAGSMDAGDGGGALLLIADQITIDGIINASGEGGLGGSGADDIDRGGAGGGSGGMIVFDAPALTIAGSGIVMAQGGGGGESSVSTLGGNPGEDPDPSTPGQRAGGGAGFANAANGGGGGTRDVDQDGEPGGNGSVINGGGGGGGTGIIRNLAGQSQIIGQVVP